MTKIWSEAFWKAPVLPRRHERPVPAPMLVAIAFLAAITVAIGLFAEPLVLFADGTGASLADPASYIEAVFGPAPSAPEPTP